jgi:hypothetical protein
VARVTGTSLLRVNLSTSLEAVGVLQVGRLVESLMLGLRARRAGESVVGM